MPMLKLFGEMSFHLFVTVKIFTVLDALPNSKIKIPVINLCYTCLEHSVILAFQPIRVQLFKWANPASFVYFRSFQPQKNCRRQWDSNSDRRSRMQARLPLDHHCPKSKCSLCELFSANQSVASVWTLFSTVFSLSELNHGPLVSAAYSCRSETFIGTTSSVLLRLAHVRKSPRQQQRGHEWDVRLSEVDPKPEGSGRRWPVRCPEEKKFSGEPMVNRYQCRAGSIVGNYLCQDRPIMST